MTTVRRFPLEHGGTRMPWAKGAVAKGFVFLSGTEGRDEETDVILPSMREQAELSLLKIKKRLQEMGTFLENIVRLTIYVTDMDEYFRDRVDRWIFDRFWKTYCPAFLEVPPVVTLLEVSSLARKGMKIEIEATAALPD
jgi:enamine deaminase RidA (YjgF/YER057c/UK114 family)